MENEEKEDLLLEVTDSEDEVYEKEEIDYYIEKKILDYIENEKPSEKSHKKAILFISTCLFMFLSSSVLIVALPIYLKYSAVNSISTYSKLVTLSLVNATFFIIAHVVGVLSKCGSHTSPNHNLSLGDVLKVSFLLSVGNVLIFWLADGSYLSCHLKDPLKGCSVVISLLFYFVFSRKKMSLERTFCAITIIVGVFISVDFGLCDKFQCNGNSNLTEVIPKLHFLYVVFYILGHGIWVLHFAVLEVCWTTFKGCSSHPNVSILSNVSSNLSSGSETLKPTIQSLSLICQEEQEEQVMRKKENLPSLKLSKSFFSKTFSKKDSYSKASEISVNSVPQRDQLSVPDFKSFPITSTPNNEMVRWHSWTSGCCYDVALWQHLTCCLVVLGLCWLPTLSVFNGGRGKLLVDVVSEVIDTLYCHLCLGCNGKCNYLPKITIIVSLSYVILMLSSIEVLKLTQSAVTVVSIMMAALPVASLFWSLFRLNGGTTSNTFLLNYILFCGVILLKKSFLLLWFFLEPLACSVPSHICLTCNSDIMEFNPEITGEAVCAVLGFPIIGIGIVLLVKSHIREFSLAV